MTPKITFKLYASLGDHLPSDKRHGNAMTLEITPGATITGVIAPFALPEKLVHLVLVNGVFIPPERRASHVLNDGDVLAIWPPIAGG